MTNSLQLLKNALVLTVAAATVLATAGLTAFAPAQVSAASYGDLIIGETLSTVYYFGSDGQRYSFPNEKTFFSWYEDFDDVVEITDEELADITLAGNIVYRPGLHWIKITSDEKTYAVARDGSIHWIESEEVAEGLAGSDWNQFIDDVPDVFFVDYTVGDSLTSADAGYEGMLWTDGTDTYLVWDGELRMVSDLDDNRFQAGFVLDGTGFDMDSYPMGDDIDGELAYLTDTAQMVEDDSYAETQDITVSLSSSSPSASTLVAAQGIAHLASFDFENNSSDAVLVTNLALNRGGVSSDSTLSNVYLFDGWLRASDAATVSSGVVTWNDAGGLFEIPAGGTATIDIRSDILTGTSGQTVSVSLDPDDVSYSGAYASTGSEIEGAEHTIATVTNFATVSFATTTSPSSDGAPEPQDDLRLWENTVSVANNEVDLYALRYRNIGSIDGDDLGNWRLYIGGVNYGDAVEGQDSNGYFAFDLSDDPVQINTGSHVFKVIADVEGGSTRTVTVGLRNAADAVFVETDYDQPVLVKANSTTFSARDATAQTIASGDITFTKATDSPSGDIVNDASNQTLASYDVRATGEAMKIESLNFHVIEDDSDTGYSLANGGIFVDGTQVGSTADLCGNDTTTAAECTAVTGSAASYTSYTFGSSFVVYPGSPVTMEVRADINDGDSTGADDVEAKDTIQVNIDITGLSSNVYRMTSGSYITRPAADVAANTLTVKVGSLTVAKNTSYAAQTVVVPKTAYKVGSWTINSTVTEDVTLTSFDVDFDADDDSGVALATADYTNLYIEYGPADDMTTSTTKGTVTTANSWSVDYDLTAGETIYVNAYADVLSGASDGVDGDDWINAELDVAGTAPASGTSISESDVVGQVITYYNAGTYTTAVAGSTPVARAVAGGQEVEAAEFRISAENEDYEILEVKIGVDSAAEAGVISQANLYDSDDVLLGSAVFDQSSNLAALFTGLHVDVASNTSETLTVKLVLNAIGTGAGAPQHNLDITLDQTKYADSAGVQTTQVVARAGNEIRAYNSIPTVAHVDLTNSTLVNGQAIDVYKFTVTADAAGEIALKQLRFPITWTDGDVDTLEMESWELYKNGTNVSDNSTAVVIQDNAGADIEDATGVVEANTDVYVIWDTSEEVISAGETVTYTLRATPSGFDSDSDPGDEDYFTIYLAGDTANHNSNGGTVGLTDVCLDDTGSGDIWTLGDTAAIGTDCTTAGTGSSAYNFIWSDMSLSGHDGTETTAADWANGWLILNLNLDGETWSK
ncbi:hypothetical protein CO174_03510 [Candidatus Uhrbacteria bacterium CG_4_9_14_3_um_filter_50_9]|uniref:LTD domain-containing protein n=1 Tax=Candidatus Uhrbacteria bacterium CG_4_9_14_3_um_filter_50_9 TaxID=1975035 RepID=A0A2M7XBW2_9BACT|nr:MAG: hypothetical protein CO174_03510 [Candidatus Uhrbacteria bacterium CG_4_9_14_3_um_filter_50_9]